MAKKKSKTEAKPLRFVGRAFVIEDHSGLSLRTLRATKDASIKELCRHSSLTWTELKEVCKCVEIEMYAKDGQIKGDD